MSHYQLNTSQFSPENIIYDRSEEDRSKQKLLSRPFIKKDENHSQ
jgi:hypothetical protein